MAVLLRMSSHSCHNLGSQHLFVRLCLSLPLVWSLKPFVPIVLGLVNAFCIS